MKSNSETFERRSAITCSPSLESLKGLKGIEYRKAWNKLHPERNRNAHREWRKRNPEKVRENGKKAYLENPERLKELRRKMKENGQLKIIHAKYYAGAENAKWKGEPWGVVEECMVMERKMSDHDLAEKLGRSVRAIQIKRFKLNKQNLSKNQEPTKQN